MGQFNFLKIHPLFGTIIFIFLSLITSGCAYPGYDGSSSNSVNSGYGYGYSGSFSGSTGGGGGGGGAGFIPGPPIGPGDFANPYFNGGGNGAFSYSIARTNNNAQVRAKSSITFIKNTGVRNYQHQGNPVYGAGYYPPGGANNGYQGVDGSAIASASINPQGYSQTAAVYPENPGSPNIFSRFGATNPAGSGGSYGVFTSSVSSSNTGADGKTHRYQQASTTVNDNGKISTYTVKNP